MIEHPKHDSILHQVPTRRRFGRHVHLHRLLRLACDGRDCGEQDGRHASVFFEPMQHE